MATVDYYTAQRPDQYKDHLTEVVAAGLNTFLAEAVKLGGGSATLSQFIKLTGVFQAPVRSYEISYNGTNGRRWANNNHSQPCNFRLRGGSTPGGAVLPGPGSTCEGARA